MDKQTRFPYEFFIVAFLWSWIFWLPIVMAGAGIFPIGKDLLNSLTVPVSMLAAFGPAVGAFYCLRRFNGKGAVRQYLRGVLDFRFGWLGWLIPIAVFAASTWFAWFLPELWGEPRLGMLLPSVLALPPYFVVMALLGGGQEELGWRGYILDPIEERLGIWLGNLVLGAIWAAWHIPLFLIPNSNQTFMPFAGFVLLTIGYSWIFSWVRQISGKRTLAGMAAHGWANAFIPLFPTLVMTSGAAQPRFWIWVSLTFVIGAAITVFRNPRWMKASERSVRGEGNPV